MRYVFTVLSWQVTRQSRLVRRAVLSAAAGTVTLVVSGCTDAPTSAPEGDRAMASVARAAGARDDASSRLDDDAGDDAQHQGLHRRSLARDPRGDFIATYAGPRARDVDARQHEVRVRGETFIFRARVDGRIGQTAGVVYVWGVNRGAGTARFSGIGVPGVLFDWVLLVDLVNGSSARDLISGVVTAIPTSAIVVDDDRLIVRVPAFALPTRGFATAAYTSNFWPRVGLGNNNQIADFAPDNSNVPVLVIR